MPIIISFHIFHLWLVILFIFVSLMLISYYYHFMCRRYALWLISLLFDYYFHMMPRYLLMMRGHHFATYFSIWAAACNAALIIARRLFYYFRLIMCARCHDFIIAHYITLLRHEPLTLFHYFIITHIIITITPLHYYYVHFRIIRLLRHYYTLTLLILMPFIITIIIIGHYY